MIKFDFRYNTPKVNDSERTMASRRRVGTMAVRQAYSSDELNSTNGGPSRSFARNSFVARLLGCLLPSVLRLSGRIIRRACGRPAIYQISKTSQHN
jgi:hypothetical protein